MFYPQLTRRSEYRSPRHKGGFYADYKQYADEIAEDCQDRCVYCDAKTVENLGGDAFQLDHFRPQKHFPDLKCDPENLVLACPACNRFKSDYWPAGKKSTVTFVGGSGFLDPFKEDRNDYFLIGPGGKISAKQDPAGFLIKLLYLDRPARDNLRRRRILIAEICALHEAISQKRKVATAAFEADEIGKAEYLECVKDLEQTNDKLVSSLSALRF